MKQSPDSRSTHSIQSRERNSSNASLTPLLALSGTIGFCNPLVFNTSSGTRSNSTTAHRIPRLSSHASFLLLLAVPSCRPVSGTSRPILTRAQDYEAQDILCLL